MGAVRRVCDRIAYERRKRTIRRFHRLYYESSWQTWKNTRWLGVTAYKTPLDLWLYQELIASLRPELIVETGTAAGGSALYLATVCDAVGCGSILTIDSVARPGRPKHERITYHTGSSVSPATLRVVAEHARGKDRVLVILDSDHSYEHVLAELRHYADLVTPGSYLVVEDTNLNGHPVVPGFGPGPKEAVRDFLAERGDLEADTGMEKFFLTFNSGGYLRKAATRVAVPTAAHRPAGARRTNPGGRARARRRAGRSLVVAIAALAFLFVALPEALGDHPYDPRPTAWVEVEHDW